MEIKKGTDRIAIIGEEETIKVPNFDSVARLSKVTKWYEEGGLEGVKTWIALDDEDDDGPSYMLFHGVRANRRESELARDFTNIVLPTRSLFFGALNIQPTVPELELEWEELKRSFVDHLFNRVAEIGHTLEKPGNFGIHDGRVKFIDAGSARVARLMYAERSKIEGALRSVEEKIGLA